ncbi:hypothetical protein EN848_33680, partial [bacterium M00.F.Ca.ET.205.01.1.1]
MLRRSALPDIRGRHLLAFAHGPDGIRANPVAPGWVRTPMSVYEMKVAASANGSTPEDEFAALTNRIAL